MRATSGAVPDEAALESKRQQLPAIDFGGDRERPPRQAALGGGGRGGGGRGGGAKPPPPKPFEQEVVLPAREPTGGGAGGGGADVGEEGGESGEETASIDAEEDFLALPVESGAGGSGSAEGEVRFRLQGTDLWLLGSEGSLPPTARTKLLAVDSHLSG